MTKDLISKLMLTKLDYDQEKKTMDSKIKILPAGERIVTPTAMFVFSECDLNAAIHHLIKSMQDPFSAGAIASVFVQESILERFLSVLKPKMPAVDDEVRKHAGFQDGLNLLQRLGAETIGNAQSSAVLAFDVTHEHLGSGATGIVTMHTFRTAKEAIALFAKESLTFKDATIWNENHSCAYELVVALSCCNFFVNCHQVPLELLKTHMNEGNYVAIANNYHYETMQVNSVQKSVVFPIGTIFAN